MKLYFESRSENSVTRFIELNKDLFDKNMYDEIFDKLLGIEYTKYGMDNGFDKLTCRRLIYYLIKENGFKFLSYMSILPSNLFEKCDLSQYDLVIPSSIKEIEGCAFAECKLKSLKISNGVKIHRLAFAWLDCNSLIIDNKVEVQSRDNTLELFFKDATLDTKIKDLYLYRDFIKKYINKYTFDGKNKKLNIHIMDDNIVYTSAKEFLVGESLI